MKSTTLLQHIGVALLLTILTAINREVFDLFFSPLVGTRLNLSFIVLIYLGLLAWQNRIPAGRVTLMAINATIILLCLILTTRLSILLWLYPLIIWINRSLLRYRSLTAVFVDMGLCLLGIGAALWTLHNGHGWAAAIWCLFLTQALHVMIPGRKMTSRAKSSSTSQDNFNRALRSAENALRELSKQSV